jgi:hypothetical protein
MSFPAAQPVRDTRRLANFLKACLKIYGTHTTCAVFEVMGRWSVGPIHPKIRWQQHTIIPRGITAEGRV